MLPNCLNHCLVKTQLNYSLGCRPDQNSQVWSFYDVSPNVALLEGNLDGGLRILLFPSE